MSCAKCKNTGMYLYYNQATWDKRPGVISGRAMTWGTCNACWGSGDELNPGQNLLKRRIEKENLRKR